MDKTQRPDETESFMEVGGVCVSKTYWSRTQRGIHVHVDRKTDVKSVFSVFPEVEWFPFIDIDNPVKNVSEVNSTYESF